MTEDEIRDYVDQYLRETCSKRLRKTDSIEKFILPRYQFKKEYPIQMGSSKRWADLVLLVNENPIVIVECKSQGRTNSGIDQLASYLCASSARLGIFANNTNPNNWTYLEKTLFNKIIVLNNEKFHTRYKEILLEQYKIEQSIEEETKRYIDKIAKERAKQHVTPSAIQERTKEMIEEAAEIRVTNFAIQTRAKEMIEPEAKKRVTDFSIQARTKALIEAEAKQRVTESAIQARVKVMTKALIEAEAKQRVTESAIQARTKEMIEAKARNHVTNSAIEARTMEITERKAREQITPSAIRARTDGIIQVEARLRVTESAIQGAVANKQEATIVSQQHEINTLKRQTNTLRDQLSDARFFAISGWVFFLCAILLSVIISLDLF